MSGQDIIGYLLAEQAFCPDCIHDLFIPFDLIGGPERSTEDVLTVIAERYGLDRNNENGFSTYIFPKPIVSSDRLGAEVCVYCGRSLNGNDYHP